mmetsp:Transcript_26671/g.50420  ORF Transcript_26671/g.50420 Transcript_26671/m.50420 type:complete len:239 (+) Transcript_26671:1164-1880(+)
MLSSAKNRRARRPTRVFLSDASEICTSLFPPDPQPLTGGAVSGISCNPRPRRLLIPLFHPGLQIVLHRVQARCWPLRGHPLLPLELLLKARGERRVPRHLLVHLRTTRLPARAGRARLLHSAASPRSPPFAAILGSALPLRCCVARLLGLTGARRLRGGFVLAAGVARAADAAAGAGFGGGKEHHLRVAVVVAHQDRMACARPRGPRTRCGTRRGPGCGVHFSFSFVIDRRMRHCKGY